MTTRSKRRRFRFSLRTLLIVMLVLCLPLAWVGTVLERTRQQKKILKQFEERATYVKFRQGYVVELNLGGYRTNGKGLFASRADLIHLKYLTRLECLFLYSPHVIDEDLAHLRHLSRREQLRLNTPHVTDAGMLHVREIAALRRLELVHANLSDSSLDNLKAMTNLERLDLWKTGVTHVRDYELRRALPGCYVDNALR